MQPASPFRLEIEDPEGWLVKYDSKPRIIPQWPESNRMTLVAVVVDDLRTTAESGSVGFVITERSQADTLCDFSCSLNNVGVLFFSVPRRTILKDAACPVGLTVESWEKTD